MQGLELGFRVGDFGCRVSGLGFRIRIRGFSDLGLGFRA